MARRHRLALLGAAALLCPLAAVAAENIKIGFPMPLSGPDRGLWRADHQGRRNGGRGHQRQGRRARP